MRYDLGLPNMCPGGDVRALIELAVLAEEAGWDGVFLEDYITHWSSRDAPTCDPWVVLAAIAQHTQRVVLGTSITPLSRRPWKLAREAVTLDHLSNGRLVLGVGLGDVNDVGFAQVGEVTEARHRASMLDEALDILVGLCRSRHLMVHVDGAFKLANPLVSSLVDSYTLLEKRAFSEEGLRQLLWIGVGECHMLIVNDEQRLRAGIRSLSKRCSYCCKPLSEYPLIMNDDAGLAVFHAACAAALATEIIVDLYTFFRPPAPYHRIFVLDPQHSAREQKARCERKE